MSIFQITPKMQRGKVIGHDVLIIKNGEQQQQYADTLENFNLDSSLNLDFEEVIYNDEYGHCVINKEYTDFPNVEFDSYIENIDTYLAAQTKRNYVAPPEPTTEEIQQSNLAELDAKYSAEISEKNDEIILAAVVEQNEEYATELRQQRTALQEEYIQKRGEL